LGEWSDKDRFSHTYYSTTFPITFGAIALGVPITTHDKLPDIILFHEARNWLYLIEAATSHGPVSHKRRHELELLLKGCTAKGVYISAFLDFAEFRRHTPQIAWETEVWIAAMPGHMIHYNGEKFLGPHE